MDPAIEHKDFTPPQQPVLRRGLLPAIIANVLLAVALWLSLQWNRGPAPEADTRTLGAPAEPAASAPEAAGPPASAALPASTAAAAASAAPARPAATQHRRPERAVPGAAAAGPPRR